MARDRVDQTPITNESMLIAYIEQGSKPKEKWRIGTEHEKFPFDLDTYRPIPYEGRNGIGQLLQDFGNKSAWEPIMDGEHIIGLSHPQGQGAISIEPGGQFELSGAAVKTIHDTKKELDTHFSTLFEVAKPLNIGFLGFGASPLWSLEETPSMPKSRYAIMSSYMPKVGNMGRDMMYRTSTVQVNIDYASEKDMRRKMQVSMKLQPLTTALFSLSPFTHGRPNGFLSWRSQIWRHTDSQRTGILPFVFHENFGFSDYVHWVLDIPMYFILREGHYIDATHISFRQFMKQGLQTLDGTHQANMGDWINHLSTVFPEVRLKQFLEMRGADAGPLPFICALPALFTGLLYEESALAEAEALVKDWSYEEVLYMRNAVPQKGLETVFKNDNLWPIAKEILNIAEKGLKKRGFYNENGQDETIYLAPLQEIIKTKRVAAEDALDRYKTIWQENIEFIFKDYAY